VYTDILYHYSNIKEWVTESKKLKTVLSIWTVYIDTVGITFWALKQYANRVTR